MGIALLSPSYELLNTVGCGEARTASLASRPGHHFVRPAAPICRVYPATHAIVKARMRPIGDTGHPAMLDRIPVDVIRVAVEIHLVADQVLPETALPYSSFTALCPALGDALAFFNHAGKVALIKFQRVEKSASPSGNVMMQCKCSGKITTASMRNGCRSRTDPNAARNTSMRSTSRLFPCVVRGSP